MNSVKKNYLYNLVYQVLAIIIPIITTPYVSRTLGATALGDYSYTFGIVTYFGILVLTGTQSFGQREIASRKSNDYEKSKTFFEILLFRVICFLIVILFYIGFISFAANQYRTLYTIHIITFFSWILDISWYYQGIENFRYIVVRNSIVKIIATCLIFIIVKSPNDLYKYALILVGSSFLGNCTFWMRIRREIVSVRLIDIHVFNNFKGIMELFIPVVAVQVYTVLDQTMIGALDNTTEVGYYSQGEKVIKLSLMIISSLSVVLLPRVSTLFTNKKLDEIQGLFAKGMSFIFVLADPMLVGCIVISPLFVPIFYGNGFEPVVNILRVLSFLFIILSVGQVCGSFLVAIHKQNVYSKAVISAAIVNVILNFFLIYSLRMGAIGAAIGTIAAETTSTLIQIMGVKQLFKPKIILHTFVRYLIPSSIMGVVLYMIMKILPVNVLGLLIAFFSSLITYLIVLVIIKDNTIMEIFSLAKGRIKK